MLYYCVGTKRIYSYVGKAWSPYSCNNRRTCLRLFSKEVFKVFKIAIANISCEDHHLESLQLDGDLDNLKTFLQKCACIPYDLYGDQA